VAVDAAKHTNFSDIHEQEPQMQKNLVGCGVSVVDATTSPSGSKAESKAGNDVGSELDSANEDKCGKYASRAPRTGSMGTSSCSASFFLIPAQYEYKVCVDRNPKTAEVIVLDGDA
jgi:hypothetical protein